MNAACRVTNAASGRVRRGTGTAPGKRRLRRTENVMRPQRFRAARRLMQVQSERGTVQRNPVFAAELLDQITRDARRRSMIGSRNTRTPTALGMQGLPSYLPSMLALEPGDASAARLFSSWAFRSELSQSK